jgi:hypothetical protein
MRVDTVRIKTGPADKASITLKAKGERLALPALPLARDPSVTVQLETTSGRAGRRCMGRQRSRTRPASSETNSHVAGALEGLPREVYTH